MIVSITHAAIGPDSVPGTPDSFRIRNHACDGDLLRNFRVLLSAPTSGGGSCGPVRQQG